MGKGIRRKREESETQQEEVGGGSTLGKKAFLLKVQSLNKQQQPNYRPHPRPSDQNLHCNKISMGFMCIFQFEKHQWRGQPWESKEDSNGDQNH